MPNEVAESLKQGGAHDHLSKIISHIVAEKPKDAYSLVEVLSRLVKGESYSPQPAELTESELEALTAHVQNSRALDKVPVTEDGEPITVPCAVPDFVEEAEMFAWAGVGLQQAESYKVMCSLRNMAAKQEGCTKIRFWGKILGTDADYFVAEAAGESGEAEEGENMDPPGSGVNAFTYFVTTDLAGDWYKLPHIKPREIVAARSIRRLLTGNPQARVVTHPFFEGKEEVLLRATIARITADTVVCVKGMLMREDPEDSASAIVENPEFAMPTATELSAKGSWIHMQPHVLRSGLTAHKELPDAEEDPAGFAAAKEEIESDPLKDVLRDLVEDGHSWVVKQFGDRAIYTDLVTKKPRCNAVTAVRSLTWPGAVCVAQRGSYANLYIGNGLKTGEPDFYPPAPPNLQDEPEDLGEVSEPQGEEEPVEAQEEADE